MKIEQASVAMQACHQFSSECEVKTDSATRFRTIMDGASGNASTSAAVSNSTNAAEGEHERLRYLLESMLARMLALFTGNEDSQVTDLREVLSAETTATPGSVAAHPMRAVEMDWSYERTETLREHESSDFSSTGKIQTADGRSLDFSLDLSLCRDYSCTKTVKSSGKAVLRDPLVINFGGKSVELSGKRFAFDLDVDGTSDLIDGLGSVSGYLAIDRNGDGRINDGSELFGAQSGDGFADLAKLDSDGNHWLDEADAAFVSLRVWQHDANGKEQLSSLRDKGVGALYLGSSDTPFSLTDSENRLLAQIRASGVYLNEDGRAGSLQQVDLAV